MAGCRNQLNAVGGWLHLFVCLSAGSDKIQRSHGPDSGGMAKSECLRLAQGPKVSPSGRKLPAGGYSENLEPRQPGASTTWSLDNLPTFLYLRLYAPAMPPLPRSPSTRKAAAGPGQMVSFYDPM
jgi:hypothetical protein